MTTQCLTSADVRLVLCRLVDDQVEFGTELTDLYAGAQVWSVRIVCHNLFVARHIAASDMGMAKVARLYAAGEEMAIEPEEGGASLVEYMLRHERNADETLDEALVAIEAGLKAHNYERAIRY